MSELKRFIYEEDAMGTVEVVLIAAVLIGIALMFKETIVKFVDGQLKNIEKGKVDVTKIGG